MHNVNCRQSEASTEQVAGISCLLFSSYYLLLTTYYLLSREKDMNIFLEQDARPGIGCARLCL